MDDTSSKVCTTSRIGRERQRQRHNDISSDAREEQSETQLARMHATMDNARRCRDAQRHMKVRSRLRELPSSSESMHASAADAEGEAQQALAIFKCEATAPVKDDKTMGISVFKRPRRTTCSDARHSYEMVNESMLARMNADEQAKYMTHMFEFFQSVGSYTSVTEARDRFFRFAEPFMLPEELRGFLSEVTHRTSGEPTSSGSGYATRVPAQACEACGASGEEFDVDEKRAEASCRRCGSVVSYAVFSDRYLPYGVERPTAPCPYRRSSHFTELLNSLQGKHQQGVPEHVIAVIQKELKKQRITDASILDRQRMRRIMKGARLNEYYSYIQAILARLQGRQPPSISPEVEAELKSMFLKVQNSFDRVIKDVMPQRRNYLSYSVLLYRFFQLLELDEYLEHIQLLTTRSKLAEQDRIWRAICDDLKWRFIAMV